MKSIVSVDCTLWLLPWHKQPILFLSVQNHICLLGPIMSELVVSFFLRGCKFYLFLILKGSGMQDDIPHKL